MLRVNYQIVYGEVFGRDANSGNEWKVLYHPANVEHGAFIYHYEKDGEKYSSLFTFLDGKQHIKNIMKNEGNLLGKEVFKVRLNTYYKQARDIVKACKDSGYEVECYCEEPQKK